MHFFEFRVLSQTQIKKASINYKKISLSLSLRQSGSVQSGPDDLIHIIVSILPKTSAEYYIWLGSGQFMIGRKAPLILFVIDRVIRLHTRFPFRRILPADDGLWLLFKNKMLVLKDSGIGHLSCREIHQSVSLPVETIQCLCLKMNRSVFQGSPISKSAIGSRIFS